MLSEQGLRRVRDQLVREELAAFMARCFATLNPGARFMPNWHIELIAEYLQACGRGELTRLIINMPPRSLKSLCVSVAWPAFLLGHAPERRVMAASYAQGLSNQHSNDCRHVMQSEWYRRLFPDTRLCREQNEKHKFATTAHGVRFATSVSGTATGEGGDVLIADDAINPLQAMSAAGREAVNGWFDHTFATRLNDKKRGVIVVVMQRLHAEDLSGYLLEKGGWEHLCLPAVAPARSVLMCGRVRKVRRKGELLHAKRENGTMIERAKRELGSAHFAAQYQQAPLTTQSSMVQLDWFTRF